jgi:hypothetical protein
VVEPVTDFAVTFVASANDKVRVPASISDGNSYAGVSVIRFGDSSLFFDRLADGTVGSSIIAVKHSRVQSQTILTTPIELTFEIVAPTTANTTFTCAYYDHDESVWRIDGVLTDVNLASIPITVTCKAFHLTGFTVILDHQNTLGSLTTEEKQGLLIVTYIGNGVSIILMSFVAFVFLYFKVSLCFCFAISFILLRTSGHPSR